MSKRSPIDEIASCTCLRLRKATRRVTQIYDQMLAPAGLTVAQFSLLARLWPEESLSIGELAEALVTDPTTLTRNLKPLIERGLLQAVNDAEDRRRRMIALTDAGRAIIPVAYPLWRKAQEQLAELLGARDIASLNSALDRSLERLARND
ncbi:MarR family winged helix-turn-helix transcriptional regulator [Methyloferula stellata]|uniref:MarR family winged helix-turn-helix transcriptional regulator n=1 Tax=Methyloferula stellata TaxID=876270 RepID=UPI00058E85FA|nr:MarR family transcriptional regulator [Methyloferula stellata]